MKKHDMRGGGGGGGSPKIDYAKQTISRKQRHMQIVFKCLYLSLKLMEVDILVS